MDTTRIASPDDPRWPEARERVVHAARGGTVAWDFDGVVADTEPLHQESYRRVLARHGYRPAPGFFAPLVGRTEPEIWEQLRQGGARVVGTTDVLADERRGVFLGLSHQHLAPGWVVTDLVPALAAAGARQVVVSNGDPATLAALLSHWGLDGSLELPRSPAGPKYERLRELCDLGPTVVVEDHADYLALAGRDGAFCVSVAHRLSPADLPCGDVALAL